MDKSSIGDTYLLDVQGKLTEVVILKVSPSNRYIKIRLADNSLGEDKWLDTTDIYHSEKL